MTRHAHILPTLTTIRGRGNKPPRCAFSAAEFGELVSGVLFWYDGATAEERAAGAGWYPMARQQASAIAAAHGLSLSRVAAVIAALSPSNLWANNLADAAGMVAAFQAGGRVAALAVPVRTYGAMKRKALTILEACDDDDETMSGLLNGRKITSFWRCILGRTDVCVDGHAYNIAQSTRTSLQDVPGMGKSVYASLQAVYTVAAQARGVDAATMQAVTWVAHRRALSIRD